MLVFREVVHVMTVMMFVGPTFGDSEGTTQAVQDGERVCNIQIDHSQDMTYVLVDYMAHCFVDTFIDLGTGIHVSRTTQELTNTFNTFCGKLPTENVCTQDVTSAAGRCLNSTQMPRLRVYLDNLKMILGVGCRRNGEQLVTFVEERRKANKSETFSLQEPCYLEFQRHVDVMYARKLTNWDVETYQVIKTFRGCIQVGVKGEDVLKRVMVSLMDDVLDKLTCIDPDNDMNVLCKTFVDTQNVM